MGKLTINDFLNSPDKPQLDHYQEELKKLNLSEIKAINACAVIPSLRSIIINDFLSNGQNMYRTLVDQSDTWGEDYFFERPVEKTSQEFILWVVGLALINKFISDLKNYYASGFPIEIENIEVLNFSTIDLKLKNKQTGDSISVKLVVWFPTKAEPTYDLASILENIKLKSKVKTRVLYKVYNKVKQQDDSEDIAILKIENFVNRIVNKYL